MASAAHSRPRHGCADENLAGNAEYPWYVPRALRGSGPHPRVVRVNRAGAGLVTGVLLLGLVACGGGPERQDESEVSGTFPVEIVTSEFPTRQRLAQTSFLRLGVKNTGKEAVPNLAITIFIEKDSIRPFSIRSEQHNLAAPDRPVWILENEYPRLAGSSAPAGAETANSKTFAFGELKPGDSTEAVWKVTPVRAGTFILHYEVDAGLHGKAKAKTSDGNAPTGEFVVQISDVPPQTRVTDEGDVVVVEPGETTAVQPGQEPGGGGQNAPPGGGQGGIQG